VKTLRPIITLTVYSLVANCGAAQTPSWAGEFVLPKKRPQEIRFGETVNGQHQSYPFSSRFSFVVFYDQHSWLRLNDGDHEGWVSKADFVLANDAPPYFSGLIQANPRDAWALHMRGTAYMRKADPDMALADFNECIRINPSDAASYNSRSLAWWAKKDHDKAIADCNEAIRLDPRFAFAFVNRGMMYASRGEFDRAITDYNEAIRLKPNDVEALNNRGWALFSKRDADRAIADFTHCIRLNPKAAMAYGNRALAYTHLGDFNRAIADYDEVLRLNPNNADVLNNRGWAWFLKKDHDRAIADFTEALRLDPKLALALQNRAHAWAAKKEVAKAIRDFEEEIKLQPKNAYPYTAMAWFQATSSDKSIRFGEYAVQNATRACELTEWKEPWCISVLAAAYAETGKFDKAIEQQKKVMAYPNAEVANQRLKLYEQNQAIRE
jgi:tetratricopeptide (TPR) repeat protein